MLLQNDGGLGCKRDELILQSFLQLTEVIYYLDLTSLIFYCINERQSIFKSLGPEAYLFYLDVPFADFRINKYTEFNSTVKKSTLVSL